MDGIEMTKLPRKEMRSVVEIAMYQKFSGYLAA